MRQKLKMITFVTIAVLAASALDAKSFAQAAGHPSGNKSRHS